uniref:Putative secreted protein n=1 Tax=Ixodes ricinus TaxID=34613 RepID=A0A6B0U252_IXORI
MHLNLGFFFFLARCFLTRLLSFTGRDVTQEKNYIPRSLRRQWQQTSFVAERVKHFAKSSLCCQAVGVCSIT